MHFNVSFAKVGALVRLVQLVVVHFYTDKILLFLQDLIIPCFLVEINPYSFLNSKSFVCQLFSA